MKTWKQELIECGSILIFAMLAWWWATNEWKKTYRVELVDMIQGVLEKELLKEKPIKIYSGAWRKGHLEVKK